MSVSYAAENFGATVGAALPLIREHAAEVGLTELPLEFDPQFEMYKTLEKAGMLRWFTAREQDGGEMVGYSLWLMAPSLEFGGVLSATNGAVYMKPEKRYHAAKFMAFAEQALKAAGVRMLTYTMWKGRQSKHLLETAGFKAMQETHWKFVEG